MKEGTEKELGWWLIFDQSIFLSKTWGRWEKTKFLHFILVHDISWEISLSDLKDLFYPSYFFLNFTSFSKMKTFNLSQ